MRCTELGAFASLLALAGCNSTEEPQTATHHGRYLGIGVYSAGRMWSRMVAANRPSADRTAADLADDEQVIVVVDSHTGEVRQCGNLTGYCIGMNPWTGALDPAQSAPVRVNAHAADLDQDAATEDASNDLSAAANAAVSNAQSR